MGTIKFFLLALTLVAITNCSPDLSCADFRSGTFYMPVSNSPKKYRTIVFDSIGKEPIEFTHDRDPNVEKYLIVRKDSKQTEWINEIATGEPVAHVRVEWIDDCTYRLKYDGSEMDLDEEQDDFQESNGIVVEKLEIRNNCMEIRSTMTTPEGHKIIQLGIICKE